MKIDAHVHTFHNSSGSLPSFPTPLQSKLKSPSSKTSPSSIVLSEMTSRVLSAADALSGRNCGGEPW